MKPVVQILTIIYLVFIKLPFVVIAAPFFTIKCSIQLLILWSKEVANPDMEHNKNSAISKRIRFFISQGETYPEALKSAYWELKNPTPEEPYWDSFSDYHNLSSPNKGPEYWGR